LATLLLCCGDGLLEAGLFEAGLFEAGLLEAGLLYVTET